MADLSISSPPFRITGACHFRDIREMPKAATRTCSQALVRRAIVPGGNLSIEPPGGIAGRHRLCTRHPRAVTQMLQLSRYRWEHMYLEARVLP